MKKKNWMGLVVGILALLFLSGCDRKPGLYIDGELVCDEELALLGDDLSQAVRMKQLQKMAAQAGDAELFSYEDMIQEMEQVNAQRVRVKKEGGILYGPETYTPFSYYQIQMGEYERLLKDEILKETEEEKLRLWYEEHKEQYRQMGMVRARFTAWEDGRIVEQKEVEADQYTIRGFSEKNETLAMHLLSLKEGETALWIDETGRECELYCLERQEEIQESFTGVKGAVMEQYASEKLEQELEKRKKHCRIEDLRENSERKGS